METEHNYTRSIWLDNDSTVVKVIDQRLLPHKIVFLDLKNVDDIIRAIKEICVRRAPLIGATAAFGTSLSDPFMTLSFLALPVIPELKITDKGLVDVSKFSIVPFFVN